MSSIKIILDSNRGSYTENRILQSAIERLQITIDPSEIFSISGSFELMDLNRFIEINSNKFIVGYIGYTMGNQLISDKLILKRPLNDLPETWLMAMDPNKVVTNKTESSIFSGLEVKPLELTQIVSKETYISKVNALKRHIQLGDIYEINYCIPFVAENIDLDSDLIWERLQSISPMPFSAYLNTDDFSIISASPERFIKREGNTVFVQPMKGTHSRGKSEAEDKRNYEQLLNDKKEQAENVMIVDLTRNDLSKIAKKGSVIVNELFGIYGFKSVYQMVSTVSCEVSEKKSFTDIFKATFPMGSMTGAPKKRAMELIEEYEDFSRGPFSGMFGYIDEKSNFDFNVMIRTIFYSKREKKLYLAVGSAITAGSNVEKEYEECLIKLQPLLQALNATIV